MHVRPACQADISAVIALFDAVSGLHGDGRKDLFKPAVGPTISQEEVLGFIAEDTPRLFVSTNDGGEVTGMLLCSMRTVQDHDVLNDSKTLWVEAMCVDDAFRGQGYGKLLLSHVKDVAKQQGCVRVELNVWAFNESARAFYEKEGMVAQRIIMEYFL